MKLFLKIQMIAILFCVCAQAKSSRGMFGLNVGVGLPFLQQAGANFYFTDHFGLDLGYNKFNLTVDSASVDLTVPELVAKWHPFGGAFFIGGGVGQESFKAVGSDALTGQTAEISVKATTMIGKLGWMWGSNNGGFWYGMDFAFYSPSSPETTIVSILPSTDPAYVDAQEQADKFGKTSFTNLTFARFGWLF